jgi:acyl-CoA thioester hydrolase
MSAGPDTASRREPDLRRRELALYAQQFGYRTLFSDMDVNRHVNNQALGRLFEEGRAELNRRAFARSLDTKPVPRFYLANLNVDFLAEISYPGTIEIGSSIGRAGTSSFTIVQAAFQDGGCVAVSDCVMVKIRDGRPAALTDAERAGLGEYLFLGAA